MKKNYDSLRDRHLGDKETPLNYPRDYHLR